MASADLRARKDAAQATNTRLKQQLEAHKSTRSDLNFSLKAQPAQDLPTPVKVTSRRFLEGHWTKVMVCVWGKTDSGEGRIASAGLDGQLIVWNADPFCDPVPKDVIIPLKCSWVQAAAFVPGCSRVATGGLDDLISIFDVDDAREMLGCSNGSEEDDLCDFDPITQLDHTQGRDVDAGRITGCHFLKSNVNHLVASSGDKTCRLWDVHRCTVISTFRHRADVESVDVKPGDESCIVSGDISGCASVWDLRTDPGKGPTHTFTDSNGSDLNSVAYFPDGNYFAAGGEDAVVTLYDLRAYKPIQTFTDPKLTPRNDSCSSVKFSSSGRLMFSAYDDSCVRIWDVLTGEQCCDIPKTMQHTERVTSLAVAPDGEAFCSASWDSNLRIWA